MDLIWSLVLIVGLLLALNHMAGGRAHHTVHVSCLARSKISFRFSPNAFCISFVGSASAKPSNEVSNYEDRIMNSLDTLGKKRSRIASAGISIMRAATTPIVTTSTI